MTAGRGFWLWWSDLTTFETEEIDHDEQSRATAGVGDEQRRQTLLAMISVGAGLEAAARHVGCSAATVYREARRDEAFCQRLREAETATQLLPLRMLRSAAGTHWRAAAWLLERSYPEWFARQKADTVSPDRVGQLLDVAAPFGGQLAAMRYDQSDQMTTARVPRSPHHYFE